MHGLRSLLNGPCAFLSADALLVCQWGFDGSTYGTHPEVQHLMALPNVQATAFCPENFSFGTPRVLCDIEGGDGNDVIAGCARVITEDGQDWTDGMVAAANEMLRIARENAVDLAILMDISASCGSQVIYAGQRANKHYQASQGVCTALLVQNGIPVVSQRDFHTLHLIERKLCPELPERQGLIDHHESEWYIGYFTK